MIRKLKSGSYRLYSRKKNPKTGKRRNLGTFKTRAAAKKHEKAVQYFKRRGIALGTQACSLCAQRSCTPLKEEVSLRNFVNQRVTNPLGAQATGLCSCGEIRHLSRLPDSAELTLLLN